MYYPAPTLYERYFASQRSPTRLFLICLVLLLLPFLAAYLDGELDHLIRDGIWRLALVHPVVIIYILLVSPLMDRVGREVFVSFRPVVRLDDSSYEQLIRTAGSVPWQHELIVASAGAIFGVWWAVSLNSYDSLSWLSAYFVLANAALYCVLVWTIYLSFATTRLTAALHNQPLEIDMFDLTPFQAIGKQSLAIAVVFIGGILLGMVFGVEPGSVRQPIFWLLYIPLALVPVSIFFLNMLPTHRVLAAEKKRLQKELEPQIISRIHRLRSSFVSSQVPPELPTELNALSSYEKRLQETRTWPYNTRQLRTLFFSVLIPAASMLLRQIIDNWQELAALLQ